MIIGGGSIAKMLNDRKDVLFFASGISDSSSKCEYLDRKREIDLMGKQIGYAVAHNLMFVYFSTISVFTHDTRYTMHKFSAEAILKLLSPNYCIVRIGNIWECTNPHTFINAYKSNPYQPRDEWKYMISKDQLLFVTDNLPVTGKHEISIFGEMKKVKDCI